MTSRVPATVASAVGGRDSIVIRHARPADGPALVEADGELVAAASPAGGEVVSDPFRVTLDVVELLRLRASQLRAAA